MELTVESGMAVEDFVNLLPMPAMVIDGDRFITGLNKPAAGLLGESLVGRH